MLQANGSTYERSAIEKWFANHDTDPETGEVLESKLVYPNRRLRNLIREFQETHMAKPAPSLPPKPAQQPAWAVLLGPQAVAGHALLSTSAGASSDSLAAQGGRVGRRGRGGRGGRGRQAA